MDEMVLEVQKWLNKTYDDINIAEDGYTGQGTVTALIKALQHELNNKGAGLAVDGDFGAGSYNAFTSIIGSIGQGSTNTNLNYIVQGDCWCKGYNPKYFDGDFGEATASAIADFQEDAGVAATGSVTAVVMKALLNTDGFKWSLSGDGDVRKVQQFLNGNYSGIYGRDIGLIPTNGVYERKTSQAMLYAVQVEGGADTDGVWGNGTKGCLPTLSEGSGKTAFVKILQCALTLNQCYSGAIDGEYDGGVTNAVKDFQFNMALESDGIAGVSTWCALLVSCGDRERAAKACDCATKLTAAKAKTLVDNGYEIVGRYLTGTYYAGNGIYKSKALDSDELKIIFNAGLKVFPIFETGGYESVYFSNNQGRIDAGIAMNAASALGFDRDTVIYFAVDCDATSEEITSYIVPYFKAVYQRYQTIGMPFKIGIYGTRNVCATVCSLRDPYTNLPYFRNAFVSDMSYGWSGNMGFTIPEEWDFDQFATVTIGSGEGEIEIDKDAYSGKNPGVSQFLPPNGMTEQKMREYNARMIFINETFNSLPLFEYFPAQVTANIPITLLDLGVIKAELEFSETVENYNGHPGATVQSSFDFINGELDDSSLMNKIQSGAIEAGFSNEETQEALSAIRQIGVGIGKGTLSVGFSRENSFQITLSYTVMSKEVPISGGGTVEVAATIKYTILLLKDFFPPDDPDLTPETVEEMIETFETEVALAPVVLLAGAGLLSIALSGAISEIVSILCSIIIAFIEQMIILAPNLVNA